jgi:hypothetical protein
VARPQTRINVSLDPEYAEKLAILAERAHIQEGTLARSLLSQAIDASDIDAHSVVEILDGIPGAFERAELGLEEIRAGRGVPLDEV